MAFGGSGFTGLLEERMQIATKLWDAGIRAEFQAKVKPKLPQQFKAAEDTPLGVILGEDELKNANPRKRLGEPDDIAGVMIYLCSRAGSYVNGEYISLDGGARLGAGRLTKI